MLHRKCLILCSLWISFSQADTEKCESEFKIIPFSSSQENKSSGRWMSYEEASAFIQDQGIKTNKQFREWNKSGKRPTNFPSNPNDTYKEEWTTWSAFFGTENISTKEKEWISHQEALDFIQTQGITNSREFEVWKQSGKRPKNFPSAPDKTYKGKGWKSWEHFFGTEKVSLEEAEAYIRNEGITSKEKFREWSNSGNRPANFPSDPKKFYKDEWISWGDFLGTGNTASYMKYVKAKKYAQSLEFAEPEDFIEWLKSKDRPVSFPLNPHQFYSEWISVKDFLSTEEYLSYEEAKAFVQYLGITNPRDFLDMMKLESDIFPENFPSSPQAFYKNNDEWIDWNDFLGVTNNTQSNEHRISHAERLLSNRNLIENPPIEQRLLNSENTSGKRNKRKRMSEENFQIEDEFTDELDLQSAEIY